MSLPRKTTLRIATGYRLQWEAAQDSHVLLYPEGMITLNESAATILQEMNGARSADDIVHELEQRFPDADLEADIVEFLEHAHERRWITSG